MITYEDSVLINTSNPQGFQVSSYVFGFTGFDIDRGYYEIVQKELENKYIVYIYGAEAIGQNYDGTTNFRRYPISSVTPIDISSKAPNLNADIVPFTDSEDNQAFSITFTGSLENANDNNVSMTYRDGLNAPITTSNLNSFPSTASLTQIKHPFTPNDQFEEIPLSFTVNSQNKNYTLIVPIGVNYSEFTFPTQSAPKAASRKTDEETDHGYTVRQASGGSPNVFFNGLAAHRENDSFPNHNRGDDVHSNRRTTSGSNSVYINGERLARVSDSISCGTKLAQGSETVFSG
tara:strand:+ start:415 stop:1284 length:870 start_codon:yes stop_codon:yes gene_type:complete